MGPEPMMFEIKGASTSCEEAIKMQLSDGQWKESKEIAVKAGLGYSTVKSGLNKLLKEGKAEVENDEVYPKRWRLK